MLSLVVFLGCLLSTISLAASVHEPRPVMKENKISSSAAPKVAPLDFSELLKSFDFNAFTEKLPKDLFEGIPEDILEKSKAALKDGKVDFESFAEKAPLPGNLSEDELLKKAADLLGISVEEFKAQQERTKKIIEEAKGEDGKLDFGKLFSFGGLGANNGLNYDDIFEL